jgi:Predicted nucleotide-binding protein containing TIR-like domain
MAEANFIVFSAGRPGINFPPALSNTPSSYEIAQAIAGRLSEVRGFRATLWTDIFDAGTVQLPVEQFLKKLLVYDASVVVLGADNVQKKADEHAYVPRDNVIVELGASLARLGTKKTFLVSPKFPGDSPKVELPSYLKGVDPLPYDVQLDQDQAVGAICASISKQYRKVSFGSDLPGTGLAYGYFSNFVVPTFAAFSDGRPNLKGSEIMELGLPAGELVFRIHIVLPKKQLLRQNVEDLLTKKDVSAAGPAVGEVLLGRKQEFWKVGLHLQDGRNISIYLKKRTSPDDPLAVYDVPTTLITSWQIIERVDELFGKQVDEDFRQTLWQKELASFRRTLEEQIRGKNMEGRIKVDPWDNFVTSAFERAR